MEHGSPREAVATSAPFFHYYGTPDSYRDVLAAGLAGRLDRDAGAVAALESRLADFVGSGHALALPQARTGLYLALRRVLTRERPEVVLSPYTLYDVVNMVLCAGGRPVFADVDAATGNLDANAAAARIGPRTGAILVTHLHGLACDIERFASLSAEQGIPLVEDCAQAFGAKVEGRRLGSFGTLGVFSFSVKKHVNCLYGGVLVGSDAAPLEACRALLAECPPERPAKLLWRAAETLVSQIAQSEPCYRALTFPLLRRRVQRGTETALSAVRFEHRPVRRDEIPESYLRRMTATQARLVARQLPDVDRQIALRSDYAREYHARLADLEGIRLPPLREDGSHIYLSFAAQVPDRLRFQRELMAAGCDVRLQPFLNLASTPCYAEFRRECPRAEQVARRTVLLPICTAAGIGEIRRVADAIRTLLR